MLNKMLKVMCQPDSSHEILAQNHELLQRFACGSSLEITHWMVQLNHLRNPTASLFILHCILCEIIWDPTGVNKNQWPKTAGSAWNCQNWLHNLQETNPLSSHKSRKDLLGTIRPAPTSLVINSWSSVWCTWPSKMDYMFNGNMCFSLNQLLMFSSFPVFFPDPKAHFEICLGPQLLPPGWHRAQAACVFAAALRYRWSDHWSAASGWPGNVSWIKFPFP